MKLTPYKKDQGRVTRVSAYLACLVLVFWGCENLFWALAARGLWNRVLFRWDLFGLKITGTPLLFACAGLFLVAALVLYLVFNTSKVAEFLIETEGELKKVAWPEAHEFLSASLAVLIMVVFIVVYVWAVDLGLREILTRLRIGY